MNTGQYTCLEIFAKQTAAGGLVRVFPVKHVSSGGENDGEGQNSMVQAAGKTYHAWLKFQVQQDTDYEILCESCEVSLCYLSGNEDILETGVCYLERRQTDGRFAIADQAAWYDQPTRETYHFSPWKNWMNDPNGMCWFKGYYHMFYQFNPHGQEWSNMYWGHAASRDLIHWSHLPVVLEPQAEILERPEEIKGGAFSGCAVAMEDEVIFYLTRHKGPLIDCGDTVEQQWMMRSRDMIHFSKEKCMIERGPGEASFDFRDPKVLPIGERWYMVLGSTVGGKGAILLYESEDMEHWEYVHPLLLEEQEKIRCFECPDFMELDGKYLAMGAWMEHRDEGGRYQMCRYYIGDWKERKLEIENSGWVDFGSNCYATQSFVHQGRRIMVGWISDFYKEHEACENGAYGSVTIPRELHIREGKLYMAPVREILSLKGDILYRGGGENVEMKEITGNAYRAEMRFNGNPFFSILLGRDGEKSLSLIHGRDGLQIVTRGVKSEGIHFGAEVEEVRTLEIYMDRRVVEVFVNEGEAAGTKVFYNTLKNGCFELYADEPEKIALAELAGMKSIWQ